MRSTIAIVNYGMGNIASLKNAIIYMGYEVELVSSAESIQNYSTIILPGVGAFPNAMKKLKESGMDEAVKHASRNEKKIIGVCLGMQLLFTESLEFGLTKGLNLIEGSVLPILKKVNLRIPHMGWNYSKPMINEYQDYGDDYYFVHSFYCEPSNQKDILFTTEYGIDFCSGVKREHNIYGLQFHPEKSQKAGLRLLSKILD